MNILSVVVHLGLSAIITFTLAPSMRIDVHAQDRPAIEVLLDKYTP